MKECLGLEREFKFRLRAPAYSCNDIMCFYFEYLKKKARIAHLKDTARNIKIF